MAGAACVRIKLNAAIVWDQRLRSLVLWLCVAHNCSVVERNYLDKKSRNILLIPRMASSWTSSPDREPNLQRLVTISLSPLRANEREIELAISLAGAANPQLYAAC